ncbi:MAG: hydrolase 2, exosortase A system-associated [Burkholderiales bacterium]|nr:hydrolase 2, exosortase A system-associated [Burkholderiales bacterium]
MSYGGNFDAFFLSAEPGARFALYHPAQGPAPRGGIVYVHPFAEEMNKSRRMAALQARAFAAAGFAVLQLDLYGCGDSAGDFDDARWEIWKQDVFLAASWLTERVPGPLYVWGLRLGATLALDAWRERPHRFDAALLWQPVLNGEVFMTQFLRLAVAGDALRGGTKSATRDELHRRLAAGENVEVGGYALSPALVCAIKRVKLADCIIPGAVINWLEVGHGKEIPPAVQRVLTNWREMEMRVDYRIVAGDPFWTTVEIAEAPALISASLEFPEAVQ